MGNRVQVGLAIAVLLVGLPSGALDLRAQTTSELDAYWAEVSRTVGEGDFEGYAALYHPDAVLVSNFSNDSYPIATALEGWKQGFMDASSGVVKASVRFRFSQRLNDGTTAHETGIFNYRVESASGEVTDQYTHFEGLLVDRDGWKMVMEYQKATATVDDWNGLN
jgi:ketosteroid isomerase-like protein